MTDSALLAKHVANGGSSLIHPKGDGTWQSTPVDRAGRITAVPGGFLLTESGTAHFINADFSRSQKTNSKVPLLDEGSGTARWTTQWEGRSAEHPVLLGDRVYVYTRERNVGTAALGLDLAGKEVQRINLPFAWNVGAGVLTHGRELFFHGLSSFGPLIVAYDSATGQQTWLEALGFGSPMPGVSGPLAVFHYPFDDGPYAVVDLAAHKLLMNGAIRGLVERGMAVAGDAAYFWGKKVDKWSSPVPQPEDP